jgi:hypothetical protein
MKTFPFLVLVLVVWAERHQQREIERLHEECCRLNEELMELNGGEKRHFNPAWWHTFQKCAALIGDRCTAPQAMRSLRETLLAE